MLVFQSVSDDLPTVPLFLRLRRALALPIYTLSLILDVASAALGCLAAAMAGDDWPEEPFSESRKAARARSGRGLGFTGRPAENESGPPSIEARRIG
jgi:hypothetical protein